MKIKRDDTVIDKITFDLERDAEWRENMKSWKEK